MQKREVLGNALGIYLGKTVIPKDTFTPKFIAALFTTARTWKQPTCPPREEWIKMQYIHTMEYDSAIKRKETVHLQTWTALKSVIQSEISHKEKKKYRILTHTHEV